MFYPSEQGNNDNSFRVPAQHILDSSGFMETWAQNFSQTDLDEGKRQAALLYVGGVADNDVITAANIRLHDESVLAYSQATGNDARLAQAPINYDEANPGRRSSAPAAPHLALQNSLATQHFTPPNLAGESQDPSRPPWATRLVWDCLGHGPLHPRVVANQRATGINASHPQRQLGLAASNPTLHVGPNAYNYLDPAFPGTPVSRDSWVPVTSGGNISSYAFEHDTANAFPPGGYQTPVSQAHPFFPQQTTSTDVPTLEVSPIDGPNYSPSIDTPTAARQFSGPRRALFHYPVPPNMGISERYPLSPQSERHRSTSIPTSASPIHSLITSPVMSSSHSPQNSESSARHRVSVQRTQEPPRNGKDEIYCNHEDCEADPPTFRRRCEWNKHMDKHERPYKCTEAGCEKLQGFTYSGGLLRHQREVHKKNGTAKATLFCPDVNCNRHTGQGFTRKENLNEHIRRRHVNQSGLEGQQSPTVTAISRTQTAPLKYEGDSSRKRKRTMDSEVETHDEEDEDNDAGFDDSGLADAEEQQEVNKRIKFEAEDYGRRERDSQKLKAEVGVLQRANQELQLMLEEKNRALVESKQRIYELERRLGNGSGRLMTAPPLS